MRLCNLTYEEALQRHPEEVAKVIQEFRSSRSKHRLAEPETLNWCYRTGVAGTSFSFRDLLEGKIPPPKVFNNAEERARDEASRTVTIICAEIGVMSRGERIANPPEVYTNALAAWNRLLQEKENIHGV